MKLLTGRRSHLLPIMLFLLLLLLPGTGQPQTADERLTLGVLAYRPVPDTEQRWQPLVDYLNAAVADLRLDLKALNYDDLENAIAAGEIDFVLSNPAHYVLLAHRDNLSSPLATMINLVQDQPSRGFGGVILVPSQQRELQQVKDLAGRTVATVSRKSLGGFQMQAFELRQQGVNILRESRVLETGMPHDLAVDTMLRGEADAAFVRSGVMEGLIHEGRLDPEVVRVLNPLPRSEFPFVLSTRLYPEWPLVALAHVDEQAALKLVTAVLALPHGGEDARRAGIYGFTLPADYRPVEQLLRELRLPPFEQSPFFTLHDAWQRWTWLIVATVLSMLFLLLLSIGMLWARRQVARQQAHTMNLLRSLGEGVYGTDRTGRCTFINDTALEMLGFTHEEVIGADQHQLFHHHTPDGREYHVEDCPVYLTAMDGRVRRLEEWFFRKDGRGFPVELVVTPVREQGKITGTIAAFKDISQRRRAEEKLQRQSEELHRSNADLEQFAYAASHDLRQPLRMVQGYLQLLVRRLGSRLSSEEQEYIFYATDGARRMDEMIVGLLNFSRVGRKGDPMAPLNGRAPLDEALAFLALDIEKSGATMKVAGRWPQVVASGDELTRLFQNLLSNAIKYVPADRTPEVEVESSVVGDCWRVEIRDNGIGIDPSQQPRLFKVFSRLQSRKKFDGTGIGLALCRRIVECHGGSIGVESAGSDQGAVFWFELPLEPKLAEEPDPDPDHQGKYHE
ncbi:PhnD/SsuA/transferrin family substrate-binding protein [Desulfurivibrio alkaliphilus]|uniref:histidine kinase n=1 Tax=Desulfurivibrio alkaliphilus (strain DSM 19089 / UNIQEM U267 / AHT2) TaxID=589865 RepID=D6Z1D0_DESAT|nr:PhnD/SsuA/transferrin family substrate-binding protein [Desulfurivibrio alkaliphilus]ADH85385.1 PAS/PAC sensor signal transduction histidine kinase [Desulfurivibrio alkaliphilus AHT 2]